MSKLADYVDVDCRILFFDDRSARIHSALKKFGDEVTIVAYAKECIKKLALEQWDVVYLDHDLDLEDFVDSSSKNCGMEVVRYLVKHKAAMENLHRTTFIIHSGNPVAATEMLWKLLDAGYKAKAERWQYE